MSRGSGFTEKLSYGGRLPWGVGLVLTVTIGVSLVVAFGSRHAGSWFDLVALVPARVLEGQVWRLVTWPLVESSPLSLLFACLMLYWFGRDLAGEWGSRRFLAVYGGLAALAAAMTCALSLVDHDIAPQRFLGTWAMACAVVVGWGLWFPGRITRFWFVLSLSGYWLAWLVVALTVVFAIYFGWEHYLPHLLAEGGMVAWLFRRSLTAKLAAVRRARQERRRERTRRDVEAKRRSSAATLRAIEADDVADEDLPPLPKELEGILGLTKKNDDAKKKK